MNKYIVQHRRGTLEQWAAKDTIIPKEGELVIEIDEGKSQHKLKIGDGIHTYAELGYLQAGDDIITQVLTQIKPRVVTIELTTNWIKVSEGKYGQDITLENITQNSRLDLQPNADMIAEFKQLGLIFNTENNGGTITVYSVGNMPSKSYTMQATIIETECNEQEAIVGIPVGVPVEVYVGDGDMPEGATIQIIMDAVNEEQALKDDLKDYIDAELAERLDNINPSVSSAEVLLKDTIAQVTYKIYVTNGKLTMEEVEPDNINPGASSAGILLKDAITQIAYKIYVMDGKLTMEEEK